MPVERHFLGWNVPVTTLVRQFLIPDDISGPIDLGKKLVIVPTRQAGRRLRETLALYCTDKKTALLSPRVVTSSYFLRPDEETSNLANATEVSAIWASVLMNVKLREFQGLFPARIPDQDYAWALHMGETIQRLRDILADGGYRITDIVHDFNEALEEFDRWNDLARLESAYFERLAANGLEDPLYLGIRRASQPAIPDKIRQVIVAAVPDPTSLMIRALENLAEQIPIDILVHAPQSLADDFDNWGRPVTSKWKQFLIDIPEPNKNILLCSSPSSQSHKVLEIIASEQDRFGPADIAIGVPDEAVIPFLASDLEDEGLPPFDPSGKSVGEHPVYSLLDSYRTLVNEGSYAAASAFLRNADVLDYLQKEHSISIYKLLEELDKFQNYRLPVGWEDIVVYFGGTTTKNQFKYLNKAIDFVNTQVAAFHEDDLENSLRSLLQTIYSVLTLDPQAPADKDFIAVAEAFDTTIRELASESVCALEIEKKHSFDLLIRRLSSQRYYTERENVLIDLDGWLELPWNDAPILIVTGMNDGSVPDSQLSDMFLPDSLRVRLNLRHDANRLARDAYLMCTLVQSRRETGRTCFITGKTSSTGDPLKPSRLLFHCADNDLPERTKILFGDSQETRPNHPATISFTLQPVPPPDIPPQNLKLSKLSVTAFKDYLSCPFRFYLKHVHGMEELDDQKTEMDALDFGSLIHEVLQTMAENDSLCRSENERELSRFLHTKADSWVKDRFGKTPPLTIQIQLDSAKQRLSAAARIQIQLNSQGWEILHNEMRVQMEINGTIVSGRIDRIDRHRETGRIRILDYKTSDRISLPETAHLGPITPDARDYSELQVNGKEKRWIDLQLPLYQMLLNGEMHFPSGVELGYFNLPKAISDTGTTIWEAFDDEQLESAKLCVEGIIADIRIKRFWPPAAKVRFDEFEKMFPADIADCIDMDELEAFMEGSL